MSSTLEVVKPEDIQWPLDQRAAEGINNNLDTIFRTLRGLLGRLELMEATLAGGVGLQELYGTANQVIVTPGPATDERTLSTPQDIATTSTPQFAGIGLGTPAEAGSVAKFAGHKYQTEYDAGTSGAAKTITWSNGNRQTLELTADTVLTFASPKAGAAYFLRFVQDATGGRVVTWPGAVMWLGGSAPVFDTAAGTIEVVAFYYDGTNYLAVSASGAGGGEQRPQCLAYTLLDSDHVTDDTWRAIEFEQETLDFGDLHSTTVNPDRFTIPAGQGGLYFILGSAAAEPVAETIGSVALFVNGTLRQMASHATWPSLAEGLPLQVMGILWLEAADYVQLQFKAWNVNPTLDCDLLPGAGLTCFSIVRIDTAGGTAGGGGDADTLDGQHGAYYRDSSNQNAGTLPLARITGLTDTQVAAAAAIDWTKISKAGSSLADLITRSAADLSSGTLANARLSADVPLDNVAETIGADCWAFTNGLKERGRSAKMGDYTSIAYAAGNFTTSNATVWTVEEADQVVFRYAQLGHFVHLRFQLQSTSLGVGNPSAPVNLVIALPFTTPAVGYQRAIGYAYFLEDDLYHKCLLQLAPGATSLNLYYISPADVLTPWPQKTLTIYCDFLFEIA